MVQWNERFKRWGFLYADAANIRRSQTDRCYGSEGIRDTLIILVRVGDPTGTVAGREPTLISAIALTPGKQGAFLTAALVFCLDRADWEHVGLLGV